jgi:hypothetical protein
MAKRARESNIEAQPELRTHQLFYYVQYKAIKCNLVQLKVLCIIQAMLNK